MARDELEKSLSRAQTTYQDSYQSFCGVDFKVAVYLPRTREWTKHYKIQEIQDEIYELEARLESIQNLRGGSQTQIQSLEKTIAALRKEQAAIRNRITNHGDSRTEGQSEVVVLDSLQTLSYQIFRGRKPVRSLGAIYPKAYTSGARFINGSMIFTSFGEHPLVPLIDTINSNHAEYGLNLTRPRWQNTDEQFLPASALADDLPPLDILVIGTNERGSASLFYLFGVQFLNDGQVISVQDLITEVTMSFVAMDIDVMRTMDTRGILKIPAINRKASASDLLTSRDYMMRKIRRTSPF